jgi:hypothetical protein
MAKIYAGERVIVSVFVLTGVPKLHGRLDISSFGGYVGWNDMLCSHLMV